ncbi:MAG: glycoside hydrolase family 97 protein [Agriterribacter sp.]
MKTTLLFLSFCCAVSIAKAQHKTLYSPNKKIQFSLAIIKGSTQYAVQFKKTKLVENSQLGLEFTGGDVWGNNIRVEDFKTSKGVEEYTMPVGKTSYVREEYTDAIIALREQSGQKRLINFHVRIFNDGVAFRYEFPAQANWKAYALTNEYTSFNMSGNPQVRVAYLENFNTSHEHRYNVLPLNQVASDTLMDVPALFTFNNGVYVAITEAALRNYAGMSLIKRKGVLGTQLSPLPGQELIKVKAELPHHTPWRVLMIGDRAGALVESNLLTNLNEPCTATDLSWLKPGKASFHWWNGDVLPDTTFEAGINFNFNKYYIDFCAANNIEYHTIIGNRGVAWYQNDGAEYQPGPNTDITKPRAGLNIAELCSYAKSKGVGIRFWVHWKALYPKLDTAFALFEKWGVSGMMVDFMDRDDQEMINIQEEILQKAMKHHLEIQFHGVAKPTGLYRTYPNESTREGTLNYENNKWGNLITPDDDISIPFTRLLAGPADYHLGGFRAMPAKDFKQQFTKPHMLGTRCHMLAMYVVLENTLSMLCDYPQAYEGQPGFEFLKEVPTIWDETKVPGAEVGEWICVARRKGNDWYLGGITNGTARTVTIPLNFLPAGNYEATIYSDAPDATEFPNHLIKTTQQLSSSGNLVMQLVAGGGQVVKLRKR